MSRRLPAGLACLVAASRTLAVTPNGQASGNERLMPVRDDAGSDTAAVTKT